MSVAVIGAGTMGSGIAQVFAMAGNQVFLQDTSKAALDRATSIIDSSLARLCEKGTLDQEGKAKALALVSRVQAVEDLAGAELVVEAVFEDTAIKKAVWRQLDKIMPPHTLLATNTSSLSVTEIAASVSNPERFCGLHFFNPAPVLPLVEVVRAFQTSDETIDKAKAWVERIGKTPIVCKDTPGFIVNRILIPYVNDAIHALSEGVASAEDIDKAMKLGANVPIGPLALADLIGLDVALAVAESLHSEFADPKFRISPLLRQMVRAGRLGRKAGEGFHHY